MRRFIFVMAIALSMTVAACDGEVDAPETQVPVQEPASSQGQPEDAPTQVPVLQPINLAGPPAGTPMVWVDGSILVHVPGGEFIMGDGGDDNPIHTVGLSSFWIYRTKVTNRMYSICVAAGKCGLPKDDDALAALSDPLKRDFPVVSVDWQQAEVYCRFVEGHLPTEAQWEKTARGPEGNIYPWGDAAPKCDLLNFKGCVGKTSDVFDYPAGKSFYDALDLSGNVFEWVADWYTPQYYSESPATDPLGPDLGEVRSVRSSSFSSEVDTLSPARRFFLDPESHRVDLGFRCVVEDPAEYAPFCVETFIPGYPGDDSGGSSTVDCPSPEFTTYSGRCVDQKAQLASGSVRVEGGEVVSVVAPSCTEVEPNLWFCTGPQGTSVPFTACLACEAEEVASPDGVNCPPGTYDNGQGVCVGRGDSQLCPTGYFFNQDSDCCTAEPNIPYPGCDPIGEYLTHLNICQPGSPPLGDSCGVVSVPLGYCSQPNDDGGGDPCRGLTQRACDSQPDVCIWEPKQEICFPLSP